jgi:hypothetical protein
MSKYFKEYHQKDDARWKAGPTKFDEGFQDRLDKGKKMTETSGGVCFALALYWIVKKIKGEDFWAWLLSGGELPDGFAGPPALPGSVGSMSMFKGGPPVDKQNIKKDKLLFKAGPVVEQVIELQRRQQTAAENMPSHKLYARALCAGDFLFKEALLNHQGFDWPPKEDPDTFTLVLARVPLADGKNAFHALAIYSGNGATDSIRLFDPNFGELILKDVAEGRLSASACLKEAYKPVAEPTIEARTFNTKPAP